MRIRTQIAHGTPPVNIEICPLKKLEEKKIKKHNHQVRIIPGPNILDPQTPFNYHQPHPVQTPTTLLAFTLSRLVT